MFGFLLSPQDIATAKKAFIRGCVTSGMFAFTESTSKQALTRATVHRALKAGLGVASGTLVANALERGDLLRSTVFIAGGATCMAVVDELLAGDGPGHSDTANDTQQVTADS